LQDRARPAQLLPVHPPSAPPDHLHPSEAFLFLANASTILARHAAGNVAQASAFTKLVQTVIDATAASPAEGGRLWVFGGAAMLTVPGTRPMAVDLPGVPKIYEAHRTNLAALQRSRLDWSMLCPGPMIASENGKPTPNLRLAVDE
jgi:putative NADH-flavin reductase